MTTSLRDSYRFCEQLSRREAKNFYYSFVLLPPERRRSMCALYAFMRRTDDLADEAGTVDEKRAALLGWRADLERAIGGDGSAWEGLPALADTVSRRGVPVRHLHEVIDGVEMDLEPKPFATFEELYAYCYRVASAVGLSCIHIWGYRSDGGRAEALAEACGVALQLTNILRDVREDASAGRIYLPQEDLARFGVSPEDLVSPRPSAALRALLEFEGRRAHEYYVKARPLARLVAPVGRPVLAAIVNIYRALLDEIARRDFDVMARRVSLPSWRKAAITFCALSGRISTPRALTTGGGPSPW